MVTQAASVLTMATEPMTDERDMHNRAEMTRLVKRQALAAGADMVGFAPVERFATGPEKTRPNYYMPRARSVVGVGIGFPRSIGEVWGTFGDRIYQSAGIDDARRVRGDGRELSVPVP